MLSGNEKLYDELISRFEKHGTADIQKINAQFDQSCAQLAALSWDQLLENGAAFGTTLVLDAVACHVASYATTQAGRAFVQTVSELLSAPQAQATEHMVEIAGLGKIALDEGPAEALSLFKKTAESHSKNPHNFSVENLKSKGRIAQENGKNFENYLVKKLGGKGPFKVKGREFDGAIRDVWYEAKSGEFWNRLILNKELLKKFKERMGTGFKIARENKVKYELYSNTPIPREIKKWLTEKKIRFVEYLEGL